MYILLFVIMVIIIYVKAFKDDFNKENIEKLVPVLVIVAGAILLLTLISSVGH